MLLEGDLKRKKRVTKHTAKGFEMFVEKCQKTRSIKCKQAKKLMETVKELSESKENAMRHLTYMEEMNVASNMRIILLKLPYKLRDKWRDRACELQEQRGDRAKFPDLVNLIEKQVKMLSDPLFGNTQDAKPATAAKSSAFVKSREKSRLRVSDFATTVTPIETSVQEKLIPIEMKRNISTTTNSLSSSLFCNKSGHTLGCCPQLRKKMHREKNRLPKGEGGLFWMSENRTHEQRLQKSFDL